LRRQLNSMRERNDIGVELTFKCHRHRYRLVVRDDRQFDAYRETHFAICDSRRPELHRMCCRCLPCCRDLSRVPQRVSAAVSLQHRLRSAVQWPSLVSFAEIRGCQMGSLILVQSMCRIGDCQIE